MAFTTLSQQIAGYVVLASDYNAFVDNDNAINNFFTVELWPDQTPAYAPLSGITAAGSETNESSGAAVDGNKPVIPIMTFIGTADRSRQWIRRWPRGYGVSATVVGSGYMTGANTDDEAVINFYLAAVSDTDTSRTAKVYDAANVLTVTVPDAIGTEFAFSLALTNVDGVVANDWVNICMMRDGDAGNDTANTGNMALTYLAINFALAS